MFFNYRAKCLRAGAFPAHFVGFLFSYLPFFGFSLLFHGNKGRHCLC